MSGGRIVSKTPGGSLKYEVLGLAIMTLAVLGMASLLFASVGAFGNLINRLLLAVAGDGRFLLPPLLFLLGLRLLRQRSATSLPVRTYGLLVIFFNLLIFLHMGITLEMAWETGFQGQGGGILGAAGSLILRHAFGQVGTYIILASLTMLSLLLLTGVSMEELARGAWRRTKMTAATTARSLTDFLFEEVEDEPEDKDKKSPAKKKPREQDTAGGRDHPPVNTTDGANKADCVTSTGQELESKSPAGEMVSPAIPFGGTSFVLPPTSLLASPKPKGSGLHSEQDIQDRIHVLEQTLENFGIKVKVLEVSIGPAITRYEIQPPPGIKVSRIVGLADDIALGMATSGVRIEAPIPGKAAVGIEVPNQSINTVPLRELLESDVFINHPSRLTVALGKDIAGTPVLADLARMPHLLVAGATGSGKSVCVNTIICSILFKATPDEVKFLMIDPKMVELTTYNGIPHLVSPVVTDPRKAAGTLRWAVREMESRYELFAAAGVRDITRYNNLCLEETARRQKSMLPRNSDAAQSLARAELAEPDQVRPLPLIAVIIDELADLMMVAPADVEDAICRLAQMARAAGIHLLVATQRPSVDVITGLIKANIPSRISFAVSSQTDSRTIIDMGGAEKLLGKGDMLFFPVGAPKPQRVQGAFLSDKEVETLVDFLKDQARPTYNEEVLKDTPLEEQWSDQENDDLLPQAALLFIESGAASISMLQRRLHIGYSRAARLVDLMERRGIVGGFEGSKPRAVLMTMEQYQQAFTEADNRAS
ncbi:MAG: DNA translocase FtsK [Bacillota bacterium]